jgi:hypothetical protein
MSGDQLQEMLDELQRLMEEGKTAEAAELMEKLRQLMENMQVVEGEGQGEGQGQGQGNGRGEKGMGGLRETLRDQQDLSDDAYRDMQEGDGQGGQEPDEQEGQGQGEAEGEGEEDGRSLTERQRDLRERLNDLQNGDLPGDGTERGEEGRRNLDRAGRAMEEAEEALRDGDLDGALDRQAEAMEAMRDGVRDFGEAMAEEQREEREPGETGEEFGRNDPNGRDPLGRENGDDGARIGSNRNLLAEDPGQRAKELLDEIRRRSGEATRQSEELDYLKRLLQLF